MPVGLLEVEGTIEVGQFWPEGRSDADTTKVVVSMAPDASEPSSQVADAQLAIAPKEPIQLMGRLLRNILRKEVSSIERLPLHVIGPVPPKPQGTTLARVPRVQRAATTPENQDRAINPPAGIAIRQIVLVIDRCRRAIFLADRVNMRLIAQRLDIGCPDRRTEAACCRTPAMEGIVDDGVGSCGQEPLRKRLWLRKQRPWPIADRQFLVGALPGIGDRNDVEDGEPLHAFAVVECEPVSDTATAIMAGDRETVEAKARHDGHHVLCHRTFGIWRVVGA